MRTPFARRLTLVVLSLAGAILACTRAEVPITPATPLAASPRAAAQVTGTATLVARTPTQAAPTATFEAATATPEVPETPAATETPVIAPPPTDTPLPPTDTPPVTDTSVPTATPIPSDTPIPAATLPGPTETPSPVPTVGSNPAGIPENATFTQKFTVTNQGGTVFGRPKDLTDGRTETWASLRGGDALWIFDLGGPQNVIGLRLFAHADANEDTTLKSIEVSSDGTNWSPVYVGDGTCGDVTQCDTLQQNEFVDFGFGPTTVQFIRLHGGPTRFAFAEAKIALAP